MNTLKTLTSAAVLVSALAGAATANTVTVTGDDTVRWQGTTPQFAGQCSFVGAADQDMNFDEASNTWTVDSTTDALITVTMRDVSDVSVTPVRNTAGNAELKKSLDGSIVGEVAVSYGGTTWDYDYDVTAPSGAVQTNTGTFTFPVGYGDSVGVTTTNGELISGTMSFDIEGTVSHSRAITDSLESQTDYYVDHMITCTQ